MEKNIKDVRDFDINMRYLIVQYYASLGISVAKPNLLYLRDNEFSKNDLAFWLNQVTNLDFIGWLASNQYLAESYIYYLKNLGCFDPNKTIEVGKGYLDTVTKKFNIPMISEFASTVGLENKTLCSHQGKPYIFSDRKDSSFEKIEKSTILLTHNPYNMEETRNLFSQIHNRRLSDINIGMFGRTSDKDFDEKRKFLLDMKKLLTDDCEFNFDTYGGAYFCTLHSKRKIKGRIIEK